MPPVGAFLAGAASFLTTGVVAGAGITGAWAAGAATASFLTTTVVGRLLTTVALSALSRAMAPKPRTPGLVTEATTTGEAASQASLFGFYATAGHHLCPPMTHGTHGKTKNAYLTYVVALSDLPGCTLQRLLVNDQPVTLATTPDANGFLGATGRFANFLWVKVYDGTQTVADPWLLSKYGTGTKQDISVGRPWLGDMVGPGLCYAIVTFRYDRPRFSGLPKLLFEIMGAPLYDPRKDSTVGGSGPHRWSDPATWEPSANPIVQVYNILRGIQVPGSGIWGLGVPAADLPLSNWFAAMNVCDQPVDGAPQYRAGFEIRFDEEPGAVIEELLKTCSGALSEMGGVWKVRAGAAGLPVQYFTDEDLMLGDSASFTPFGSLNETHNGVTASYPDPEALWQPKEAPPRYNAAWEAEDFNRQLVAALDLPACPYPVQVQRLMRAWIEDERRFRRHSLTLPPDAAILEPLDVVSWTSAENGYVEKTFEVVEIGDDPGTMIQRLALREVNAADYDWSPADQIPWDISPVGPDVPPDLTPDAFTVTGIEIRDGQNIGRRPALRLEWSEEDFELITAVEWELRRSGTTEVIATGTMNNPAARAVVVSAGLIGATSYDARIRYIAPALTTLWTGWVTASTPDVRLTAEDISTAVMQEIAEAQAAADQAVAEAASALAKALSVEATSESALVLRPIGGTGAANIRIVEWDDAAGAGSAIVLAGDNVIAPGTLSTSRLVVHDNSAVFSEVFDSAAALAQWQNHAGLGELAIVSSAHARQGGKVLQVGNNSGDDQAWYVARTLIPFDPDRTYRIRAGLRKNAGAGMIYLGFVGVAADGVTLVNNTGANTHTAQFYAPSGGQSPALNTYTEITGYVRGVGSGGAGTLASPRMIHANVRYLRPVIIVNYETVAGQTLVDYVKVDTVSDATLIADGAISTEKIVAGAITAASGIIADAAIANAKIANGAITTAKIADLQVNTIKIANNAITSLVATEISSGSPSFSFTATVGTSAVVFATFQVAISTWFNSENSNGEYYSYNVSLNGKSIGGGYTSVNNTNLSPFWESFAIPVQITQSSNTISVSGAIVSSSSKVGLGALKVLK
ncbi:phage tail protein [Phaeovulum sp. NW3]|uniref:phage tail protein n=1 Tax=Phaeovulum sp. NW3 TaxID=2934933 RepID=UPI0020223B9F|nr:phage tail protein [Phaeovulum sp. NW3]MCL7466345.1 phage tail protein [Phaeovulum sp. NW3]